MTKVVCCISGKGGVGKSTTSINLGLALHQYGKNTAVLDANLTTPNIGVYLGESTFSITSYTCVLCTNSFGSMY